MIRHATIGVVGLITAVLGLWLAPSAHAEKHNWMDDALMNLLVDYYPEVQFRPYGSGATRENVLPALKQLRLGYLCVYAKGHSGYATYGDPQMLRWLREIVEQIDPKPTLTTDAPSWVDLSLRRKGPEWLVHLVNQNPGRDVARLNTDDTWVDEIPTIGPITCRLRLAERPSAVSVVPAGPPVEWTWNAGWLEMRLARLAIHACLVVR